MPDTSLKDLPRQKRRELQNQVGLVPLEPSPDTHPKRRKKGRRHMQDNGTQAQRIENKDRARRSLEEFFQTPSAWELAKQSAVKAAVYAPVAIGVGTGLLFIARRMFVPR